MSNIRIFQYTHFLKTGDGVGNDVLAIHKFLTEQKKIDARIFYGVTAERFNSGKIKSIDHAVETKDDDILMIHVSTEWDYMDTLCELKGRKIFVYHNITPPEFFEDYSFHVYENCKKGLEELKRCKDKADYCLADSEFNKSDLVKYGYECPIDVLPIIIPFDDYKQPVDEAFASELSDGKTNILFVGRIAPNKKQEDIILSFYHYKKYYNPDSRLILLGGYDENDKYYQKLLKYIEEIGVEDVRLTSHIPFKQVLAIFKSAHLFLCLSEHEGFCIPLLEAMSFEIPIIAYDSTAVKDTLGGGGILIKEKNPLEIAGLMDYVLKHEDIVSTIKERQKERLEEMKYENVTGKLWDYLTKFEPGLLQ
ncbi:MAG: glycosyltransferase family 4 protein [Lachnospiraceae bacterium]|nr:glycosyltransferase family 4 protein [Lachnospiraceae bacterium]